MESISQEAYEQVKAQVLEEQKAERAERVRLNTERRRELKKAANELFEPTRKAYYTRIIAYFQKRIRNGLRIDLEKQIECEFDRVERMVRGRMYMCSNRDIVLEHREEEANLFAQEILETMLKG